MNSSNQYNTISIPSDVENNISSLTINTTNTTTNTTNTTDTTNLNLHKVERNNYNQTAKTCCFALCASLIIIIFCLPFIICDLYFAFNNISCQHDLNPVGITLSTWLQTSGFIVISYLVSLLVLIPLSASNECIKCLLNIIKYLITGFSVAWIIVGSIIFWKYLEPSGTCDKSISNYMWARLIIGLIGIYINSRSNEKKK